MSVKIVIPMLLLLLIGLHIPAYADEINVLSGPPPHVSAMFYRSMAAHNRLAGRTGDSRSYNPGSGNQAVGDFSQSNNRNLREVNIFANDIVNINRSY